MEDNSDKKNIRVNYLLIRNPYIQFQDSSFHVQNFQKCDMHTPNGQVKAKTPLQLFQSLGNRNVGLVSSYSGRLFAIWTPLDLSQYLDRIPYGISKIFSFLSLTTVCARKRNYAAKRSKTMTDQSIYPRFSVTDNLQ